MDIYYRYFYLEGRDLGSYGYDTDTTLVNLLEEIIENHRQESYKIFLYNISPNSLIELYPDLERVLASKKIFHLGSHIQSGSKRILKLMGKNLSIGKWVEVIKEIQKKHPKIEIGTSIMVGFPSETEKDFAESVNLLHEVLFDTVDVYKYSERPNLPSLRIKNRIPETIKNKRYKQIRNNQTLCKTKKRIRCAQFLTLNDINLFLNMTHTLLRSRV